jgi:hypothetical protein
MPRKTKKAALMAQQDPAAPFLFDEDKLPIRDDVVRAIATGAHKHTGARLLDNDKLVLRMVELLMAGWGLKKIARTIGVSKHSVRAARETLVARGELAPYKQRVVAMMEDCIELGLHNYREALENDELPAAQIPIGMGIISDKRALALGEPTSIAASATAAQEELSVEKLNAWVDSLKPAKVASADSSSGEKLQIPAETRKEGEP